MSRTLISAALAAATGTTAGLRPDPSDGFANFDITGDNALRSYSSQPWPPSTTGDRRAPDIFGSVALAVGQTSSTARWRRVAAASLPGGGPWTSVLERARALPPRDQRRLVNAWVNHAIVFTDDARLYRTSDYWATAAEALRRGRGDCEDYVIAKMQLLRDLGVPSDQLYLVLARDLVRHAEHALLAVRADGRFWILDNETDAVLPADQVRDYRPILTFSGSHSWVHGYRRAPAVVIADARPLSPRSVGRVDNTRTSIHAAKP